MKRFILILTLIGLLTMGGAVSAQSEVSFVFFACENQAVVDFNGVMGSGYDLYIQVFRDLGATGTQLTNLIRVPVSGEYQVSQVLPYGNGETVLFGQFASARITMARETDPSREIFAEVVQDSQDGCVEPSFPSVDGIDAGGGGTTPVIDPVTGNVIDAVAGEVISSSGIFTPDGGVLNDITAQQGDAIVQIGARQNSLSIFSGRSSDAGWIFAECDAFPLANPGVLWDTDNLTVFWSWYASSARLVQDHIDHAQYEVFLSSPYSYRQPFPQVDVSPITLREDGNYWVFYTANLGDGFKSGEYKVDYYVTWDEAISDGYGDFGPGTDTVGLLNTCTFNVQLNPFGLRTDLDNPTAPLQVNN